jgi:hypothetical protein
LRRRHRKDYSSDSDSDISERRRRRRRKRKKHDKKKKSKRKRKEDSDSSDDGGEVRRSVITGKKIKMKIDKTDDDRAQEEARRQLLDFMNSSYK